MQKCLFVFFKYESLREALKFYFVKLYRYGDGFDSLFTFKDDFNGNYPQIKPIMRKRH